MPGLLVNVDVGLYNEEVLNNYVVDVFKYRGLKESEALDASSVLLRADKARIWSHGMHRLEYYDWMFENDRINPSPKVRVVRGDKSIQTIDGDNGCGLVVGPIANRICMDLVNKYDSGSVAVFNSNHFGALREYLLENTRRNLACQVYTNTSSLVTPIYAGERFLGTNPIAMGFPTSKDPIIGDMATPTVAVGKLEVAIDLGIKVPLGWVVDKFGKPTTDPNVIREGGALVGLGGTREGGGHKGTSLGTLVEILSLLGGSRFGKGVPPFQPNAPIPGKNLGKGTGHFFYSLNPFVLNPNYLEYVDKFVEDYRNIRPANNDGNNFLLTGDPELIAEKESEKNGIMIPLRIMKIASEKVARKSGIPFPEPLKVIENFEIEY